LKADLGKRETRNTDKDKRAQLIAADQSKVQAAMAAVQEFEEQYKDALR
jgi:hypothetical protein